MTRVTPYTFREVFDKISDNLNGTYVPRDHVSVILNQSLMSAEVFLHGGLIATMYANGNIELHASEDMSGMTRSRLNDILQPIGWKIIIRGDRLFLSPEHLNTPRIEYHRGFLVTPYRNEKGDHHA